LNHQSHRATKTVFKPLPLINVSGSSDHSTITSVFIVANPALHSQLDCCGSVVTRILIVLAIISMALIVVVALLIMAVLDGTQLQVAAAVRLRVPGSVDPHSRLSNPKRAESANELPVAQVNNTVGVQAPATITMVTYGRQSEDVSPNHENLRSFERELVRGNYENLPIFEDEQGSVEPHSRLSNSKRAESVVQVDDTVDVQAAPSVVIIIARGQQSEGVPRSHENLGRFEVEGVRRNHEDPVIFEGTSLNGTVGKRIIVSENSSNVHQRHSRILIPEDASTPISGPPGGDPSGNK
jgi:hypothetical protein